VPASRHTYAKLALNATYMGLFSVVEQVDKRFLKDRFGDNDEGNLYKGLLQRRRVSWIAPDRVVVVSDRAKRDGRQDDRCRAKDQSIHVFAIPGPG